MDVQHFSAVNQGRFFIEINAGSAKRLQSELLYKKEGNIIDLYHTFTPEELRGKGLADQLVRFAFDYAKKHNLKIKPTCPYITDVFLKKYPELKTMTVPL